MTLSLCVFDAGGRKHEMMVDLPPHPSFSSSSATLPRCRVALPPMGKNGGGKEGGGSGLLEVLKGGREGRREGGRERGREGGREESLVLTCPLHPHAPALFSSPVHTQLRSSPSSSSSTSSSSSFSSSSLFHLRAAKRQFEECLRACQDFWEVRGREGGREGGKKTGDFTSCYQTSGARAVTRPSFPPSRPPSLPPRPR